MTTQVNDDQSGMIHHLQDIIQNAHLILDILYMKDISLPALVGRRCPSMQDITDKTCKASLFRCNDRHCISDMYMNDGEADCPDGSDEVSPTDMCTHPIRASCDQCRQETCVCGLNYFQCHSHGCVRWDRVCDMSPDCPDESDKIFCVQVDNVILNNYEYFTETFTRRTTFTNLPHKNQVAPKCSSDVQIPCSMEGSSCFPIHWLCVYDRDRYGNKRYCQHGTHLKNCADFSCPAKYKCPGSYCIPTRRVCDGEKDCPEGQNEHGCMDKPLSCPGFYRCRGGVCIHPHEVCDGYTDCEADGDDEALCQLAPCLDQCQCRIRSMACYLNNPLVILDLVVSVKLSGLTDLPLLVNGTSLINLDLSNNRLTLIKSTGFVELTRLIYLDLSDNQIEYIEKDVFIALSNVIVLKLGQNKWSTYAPSSTFLAYCI